MDGKKKIVFSILEFLTEEYGLPTTSADSKESLEVATQCLETAFGVTVQDKQFKSKKTLREMFEEVERGIPPTAQGDGAAAAAEQSFVDALNVDLGPPYDAPPESTADEKMIAEDFKNKGNDAMRSNNFNDALLNYSSAVDMDGRNSVYFCNRAAAYIKLEQYDQALRDCQIAVRLQPNYARAYGRMGVTYSSRSKHVDAIMCYKKALMLEPTNESYVTNLRYSQTMLAQEAQNPSADAANSILGGGIENLMRNPNLINMASQMLRDPSMNQMIQNLMGGLTQTQQQSPPSNESTAQSPPQSQPQPQPTLPLDSLMQMGQAIANSLRTSNPDLAAQLGVGGPATNVNFRNGQPDNSDNQPES